MPTLSVRSDQRLGAIGQTQSGKTFLMQHLCEAQKNVLVIDSKQRINWPGYFLTYDLRATLIEPKTIYRHGDAGIPDNFWSRAVESLHERGGGVIYIDELPVLTGPNRIQQGLAGAFRLGAEIGVAVWWAAQESTGVHNTALRQSEILCLFFNQGASDRDKIIKTCGDIGEVTAHLAPREFVVFENSSVAAYDSAAIPTYTVDDPENSITVRRG